MKTRMLPLVCFAAVFIGAAVAAPKDAASKPAPAAPAKTMLQISVQVPPTMRPWLEDDVAEAFADRVQTALHEQGLKDGVVCLRPSEEPVPDKALLQVHLLEWRTDHAGMVDCTFSATLSARKQSRSLGLFIGTGMMMTSRRDWFGRVEQYDDAARQALRDLLERIRQTHLLEESQPSQAAPATAH